MRLLLTVLAPFAFGYFLSNLYRAINAVVAPDLVQDVGLSATALGTLTAAYLIAFALFQLPLGVLLDRFGPRRVQTALLATAAIGSLAFSRGDSALTLTAARALIGLGFAGGLMAGFKAVVLWYRPERHALANAAIMSFGGLGMLVATVPAELVIQHVGWRGLFVGAGAITLAGAVIVFTVVPESQASGQTTSLRQQLDGIRQVYRDRFFWRVVPLVALTAGTHVAITTLWAVPWLRDVAGFDRADVALHLLVIAVAFLAGTLLSGIIADRLGRHGVDPLHVMLVSLALFAIAQIVVIAEWGELHMLTWALFGMTGQVGVLAYPRLSAHFGAALSGRAQTCANLLLFLAAFAAQWAVGVVIDLFPAGELGGYVPAGYRAAFSMLLALQLLAFAYYALARRE